LFTPEAAAATALLAAAFAGLFFRWFYTQHLFSSNQMEDWGHAYVIPLISLYLIRQSRDALARVKPETFWPGLAPFLLGIMCYFFFVASRFTGGHMIQGWAVILTLFGLVLLLLGPRAMRYLFIPIAFLVFGVTVSDMIMIRLTFPLKLIASQGAYLVLSVIGAFAGFSADVNGNMLHVITSSGTDIPLNVADACSGMRTVVAFFALAASAAVLGCRQWWQRVALLLLAAPVAILINVGRVATLGLLSLADPNLASGQAHTLIGTLLLIPGLLLFMGIIWALNRAVHDERPPKPGARA
jgi:exosortase